VQNIKLELKEENMPTINKTKHPTKRRVQDIKLELKEENLPTINKTKHPTKRRVQDIKLELKEENLPTINKTKHPTKGEKRIQDNRTSVGQFSLGDPVLSPVLTFRTNCFHSGFS